MALRSDPSHEELRRLLESKTSVHAKQELGCAAKLIASKTQQVRVDVGFPFEVCLKQTAFIQSDLTRSEKIKSRATLSPSAPSAQQKFIESCLAALLTRAGSIVTLCPTRTSSCVWQTRSKSASLHSRLLDHPKTKSGPDLRAAAC